MFKIVATFFIPNVDLGEENAKEIGAELVKRLCRTGAEANEDELYAVAQDADAVITNIQPYTRRVIERLRKCRVISAIGIGYDWIDVQAATDHGICVVNVPDYCLEEVSAHAMALLLACSRKLVRVFDAVRAGKWNSAVPVEIRQGIQPPMFRLKGQTLGLVGFGNIARTLVPMAKGFGLRVIAYDPRVTASVGQQYGVELMGLDRLLEQSDFVSLHASLATETRHMLGLKELKKMKPTAYFINTARGGLVDEEALYTALSEGYIAGAGLDVLDPEPPNPDNPLLKLHNVIITAHMAQYSDRAEQELWRRPAEAAIQVLKGEWPRGLVNAQVKEKFVARWGEMK
ncbi:MAG: C-terminal binding protein [Candidatus Tectomicrobia bacterium]|uniref:C-terminal binding protein n=1 Tax=Tectimicrobiota bacterium TaxID=2528274 RepID=A0A933LR70_UNCTE|nr:C-terminal binding protein [Candidatus Tectomicrobia bacterium]